MADEIIIVDVEATCWQGAPPPGQHSEIIEVGICLLGLKTRTLSDKRSILVRPQRSTVSFFCTELTTLTQEQVDEGVPFHEACALLEADFRSRERVWASWGAYDRNMFRSQCKGFGVPYPFGEKHVNIKQLFADLRGHRPVGMGGALRRVEMALEGTHHRAHDDAWNIGRLLIYLLEHYEQESLSEISDG